MGQSRLLITTALLVLGLATTAFLWPKIPAPTNSSTESVAQITNQVNSNIVPGANRNLSTSSANISPTNTSVTRDVHLPLDGFFDRVTKKPFGIHITPATSPVQPEKFSGYHTGVDAEATASEATTDVPVYAIAGGTVAIVRYVNGYGGVVIIRHDQGRETVTALYGHVRLSSVSVRVGTNVTAGQKIAVLGTGFSSETDQERKHLHLSLLKGLTIDYRGYVSTSSQLSPWLDPVAWLHQQGL